MPREQFSYRNWREGAEMKRPASLVSAIVFWLIALAQLLHPPCASDGRQLRQLREKNGQVYCADCLAKDLEQDPSEVRAAMDVLAPLENFSAGSCPCGQTRLMLRW